jgi:hypothetical protein
MDGNERLDDMLYRNRFVLFCVLMGAWSLYAGFYSLDESRHLAATGRRLLSFVAAPNSGLISGGNAFLVSAGHSQRRARIYFLIAVAWLLAAILRHLRNRRTRANFATEDTPFSLGSERPSRSL